MTLTDTTPKIYVGTYKKYNEGSLEGKWIDLTDFSSKDEFYEAIAELHSDEEDPEFMFQDYEYIPEGFIGESWISENFWPFMEALDNMDNNTKEAFEIFVKNRSFDLSKEDIDSIIRDFEDSYRGHYSNGLEDYAYELVEECYFTKDTHDFIKRYFDYKSFARDLGFDGYWEEDGHVFIN